MASFSAKPPLGLCIIGTIARRQGFDVKLIMKKNAHKNYTNEEIAQIAKEYKPDIIGMTMFDGYNIMSIYKLAEKLQGTAKIMIAGGPHTAFCSDEVLENGFDVTVRGEGEITFSEFLKVWNKPDKWHLIDGISYKNGKKIIHNQNRELIKNLDEAILPDRDFVEMNAFSKDDKKHFNAFGNILTSRGCPALCVFCSKGVFGNRYRFRSPENVINEIKDIHDKYGTTYFSFEDDSFTVDVNRVIKIMKMIQELPFKITFWCQTRVVCINRDLLREMKKAGCIEVSFGVESGDPDVQKLLKKGITLELAERAIKMTYEEGIEVSANFMMGFPFETVENLQNTLNFIKRISPHVGIFSAAGIPVPHPGAPLYVGNHEKYGFANWWIKPEFDSSRRKARLYHRLGFFNDFALESNFFKYDKQTKKKILDILIFMGMHNTLRSRLRRHLSNTEKRYLITISRISVKLSSISYTLDDILKLFHSTSRKILHSN